jgi:predicted PurR-regulated permease PerM
MSDKLPPVRSAAPPSSAQGLSLADRLSLPRLHWGWLVFLVGLGALGWASRGVLGPFVAAFILAYLLDPLATRLQRSKGGKIGRSLASALVLGLAVAFLAALLLATAPIIESQIFQLVRQMPTLIETTMQLIDRLVKESGGAINIDTMIDQLDDRAIGWLTSGFSGVLSGGLAFVNIVNFLLITPIVTFYLLRDWSAIVRHIETWLPPRARPEVRRVAGEADAALGGFVRGQSLVCLILAVFYAIGWSLVGLDYALVLGILAGVFGFVPFLGVIVAVALSLLVALGQFGLDWFQLLLVYGVFQIGQLLESAVLTPNLIGTKIGLHPVWVLFAVFAGGAVAGLAGVFLAVPVAAVLGVVVRAAFAHYRRSDFYHEQVPPPPAA